jgi:2-C-methyl-D-erythritol 2,4-cyclodiphosphate synthase
MANETEKSNHRIGMGYDVHRLVHGRPLILGGVPIPFEKGLLGHSDADVLTHAVCDAVLGALGLGDIGRHFSDDDKAYKDINSLKLLEKCYDMMHSGGYHLINLDAVILAQAPKVNPFKAKMEAKLAGILHSSSEKVNVKATTTEGLGFIGRGEGMAAKCVVLVGCDEPAKKVVYGNI